MLYSLVYIVVRFLLEILIVRDRSEVRLRAEVLALRHQLAVLECQVGGPCWQPSDRLVMAAIRRVLPSLHLRSAPLPGGSGSSAPEMWLSSLGA